jgi:hypothetical protein
LLSSRFVTMGQLIDQARIIEQNLAQFRIELLPLKFARKPYTESSEAMSFSAAVFVGIKEGLVE